MNALLRICCPLAVLFLAAACGPRHTLEIGPVAQKVFEQGTIDTPEQAEINSEATVEVAHSMVTQMFPDALIDIRRLTLLKGRGGYVRIMGAIDESKEVTLVFVVVLRNGEEVYREVGSRVARGTYPEGDFPKGRYAKNG